MQLTKMQRKTAKTIVGIHETGELIAPPETLTIIKGEEKAVGVTFGAFQTTENGGGLWHLIFDYYLQMSPLPENYAYFSKFKDVLYKKGRSGLGTKGAITYNEEFKRRLIDAALHDPAMLQAQRIHFEDRYFKPSLGICTDYALTLPLSASIVYDICIQSGPELAEKLIETFDAEEYNPSKDLEELDGDAYDLGSEKDFVSQLVKSRSSWLRDWKNHNKQRQAAVRRSAYRMDSFERLIGQEEWMLKLPLQYRLVMEKIGLKNKDFKITQESLEANKTL